jgi:D-glycero-alpha-D-manno-heptose-7-phosphate kinase
MIISRTPLRISFSGGGTDIRQYYSSPNRHGVVVSTTINKYIYITVNKKFDDQIRVSYSKTEIVDHVDELEHNIIREALKIVGIERGVEIVYMADLPLTSGGSGLGSSSALAVGVLNALYAYKNQHASAEKLAQDAVRIERDILGYPVGKQDQYSAAYGGLNFIKFNGDESVLVEPIVCNPETKHMLSNNLMLFYTGLSRLSSAILEDQQRRVVNTLILHDSLVEITYKLRVNLINNNLDTIGGDLDEGWRIKKNLASGISNTQIDDWYERAKAFGVQGGKLAGAGGGGFFLFCCDPSQQEKVRLELRELKENKFSFEPQGSKIIYVSD